MFEIIGYIEFCSWSFLACQSVSANHISVGSLPCASLHAEHFISPPPTRGQSLKCYYLVCIISVRLLVAYLIMVIIECVVGYQLSQRAQMIFSIDGVSTLSD